MSPQGVAGKLERCMVQLHVSLCIASPCNLLVCHKLDCLVGNDPDAIGTIALKHSPHAFPVVHVLASLKSRLES